MSLLENPTRETHHARGKIAQARGNFPGALNGAYVDVSARGLISTPVRAAIDGFLDQRMFGGDKNAMFATVERVRGLFARLIKAEADEITFTKNISEGLNIVAQALSWKAGSNVVICSELEHPANVYPWLRLRGQRGVGIKTVAPVDGLISPEAIIAAIDRNTAMVTISSATFAPGFVTDVAAIGRYCRERGIFLLVDGAQSVGIIDMDVDAMGIDGLAVSTQKGLLALYGMGMLYIRKSWAEQMHPAYLSRFSVDLGDAHEASLGDENYKLAAGARRFDLGNYNYIASTAVEKSLELLLDIGTPAIEGHVRALARRLTGGLAELCLPLYGSTDLPQLGSIVCVGSSDSKVHDSTGDADMADLYEHLKKAGVTLSIRRNMLRLSLHLYNNDDDIDQILELARDWSNTRARPR